MVECVLLAGAPADQWNEAGHNIKFRAEAPVAGKPMSQWVVEALQGSRVVSRIIQVGGPETVGIERLEPEDSFLENLLKGVETCSADEHILVASADIPMVTAVAIADFVKSGLETGADLVYPIIRKEDCMSQYPELKRTFVRVLEGTFTGGNIVLVDKGFLLSNKARIQRLYNSRKTPLKLAGMIGYGLVIRFLLAQFIWPGFLRIKSVETAASKALGGKLKAVVSGWPEIGEDVDRPEDAAIVDRILHNRANIG